MTNFLFWSFVLLVGLGLWKVLKRPEKIYEYPQFMSAVFAIFILPQAVSLLRFPGAAPEEAIRRVFGMGCLCMGACLAGYTVISEPRRQGKTSYILDPSRLFHAGIAFVACGLVFSYVLGRIDVRTSETGGWTGPATIYGFFQQLCYPGFAICLMVCLRQPSLLSVGATLLATVVPIQSILFGRREPAAQFALTIGLALYFQVKLRPPRWLIAAIIVMAMLAIPATATYRRFQLEREWTSVRQINLVDNFREFLGEESVLELRNAAMLIEATRRSGDYEYGAGYWNHLIFRYVPAQVVGEGVKDSLMIRISREGLERELATVGYVNPAGSTVTGLGDSFQQFGYWGCLFFALLGVGFHQLWRAATVPATALFAQLLYIQSCTSAMRAVTHWTLDFLPGFLYALIFLGLALWYAQVPSELPSGGINTRARGINRQHKTQSATVEKSIRQKKVRWSPLSFRNPPFRRGGLSQH